MITARLNPVDQARFSRALVAYTALAKGTIDEILNKKGNDIRIQLLKLYKELRWAPSKRAAKDELLAMVRSGKGIKIRPETEANVDRWASKRARGHAKLVSAEINRRAAGRGVLGASFVVRRWRGGKDKRYLVYNKNKAGQTLMLIRRDPNTFSLTGYTPGLALMDSKTGIVSKALRNVTADMRAYILGKMGLAKRKAFRR